MSVIPSDRKYLSSHLWFLPQQDNPQQGTMGLTDDFQARLGDLIAIEMPREGVLLTPEDTFVYCEGILDAIEIPALAGMEVIKTNPKLEVNPDLANRDPYSKGFLAQVRWKGVPRFLSAVEYADYLRDGAVGGA